MYIGVLSGTSVDGVDCALVDFSSPFPVVLQSVSTPIPDDLRHAILAACHPGGDDVHSVASLDQRLGELFAASVTALLRQANIDPQAVRAVGSHGQTIRHHPDGEFPYTVQIGDPNQIAERTGIATVGDFRRRDMAAGGQGAPLAPAFHVARFRHQSERRGVLNLGGIANITLIPAGTDPEPAIGFDTGPSNTLLDAWYRQHRGAGFDTDGAWARQGSVQDALLEAMLREPYLSLPAPKSTGPELFNLDWLRGHLGGLPLPTADVQATLLEFTARSVRDAIRALPGRPLDRLLVCGGGIHNRALLGRIGALLEPTPVHSSEEYGVPPDWVEAVAFAWMARQTLQGLAGNLPEVTGARRPVVLGAVYAGGVIPAPVKDRLERP